MSERSQELITQGAELMAAQKYAEAKDVFGAAVQADRRDVEACLNLGNACVSNGDIDEGIAAFKRALVIDKESTDAHFSLGCAYFLKNDYGNAMRHFNKVEAQGGATVEMYQIEMAMFADSDDLSMAIRSANRAIQLDPLNVGLRVSKVELYLGAQKIPEAVAAAHEIQEILPDESAGYAVEAEVLLNADEEDGALAALDKAIARFPEDPSLLTIKARTLNNLGRYTEALACCKKASTLNPESESTKNDLALQEGIALGALGKLDESITRLEQCAESDQNALNAYFTILNECMVLKDFARAEFYAQKILDMDDDVPERVRANAYFCLARAVQQQGRADEAKERYEDAARELRRINILNPGLYEVYGYRVYAHIALEEYEDALELSEHLINIDGGSAATFALKYEVVKAMGNETEAAALKARVLELEPNYTFGDEDE